MTEAATVCVALSVKDGGAYLSESITSVLAQEDVALELRIYDNGSTDGSFELAGRYRDDPRVSVNANPAGSRFFDSMNRALAETSARWLVPWAADDLMLPGSIATRLSAGERSGAQFVFTPVVSIDSDGRLGRTLCNEVGDAEVVLDAPDLFLRIAPWNTVAMPAVMAETAALRAVGGFERRLARCGDWLMWLRLSLRVRSVYLPEPAVLYRVHDANDTHASRRAGAFATELVSTIRAAFRDPAFPPAWRPLLRDHLISIMRGQATMHLHDGLVRASHCSHPAYLVAFEALLLDPDDDAVRAQYLDAVRAAGLPPTSFPVEIVAAPEPSAEAVGACMRGVRRLLASPGLIGGVQLAAQPDRLDEVVALVEHDLARNGDVELELSLTPDALSLLRPGGMFLAPIGDPRSAIVEQLCGVTVCWERTPDPLDADPGD